MKVSRFLRAPQGRLQAGSLLLVVAIGLAAAVFAGVGSREYASQCCDSGMGEGVCQVRRRQERSGAANAKLAPVTVGWVNAQGGIVQSPESTTSIQAAVAVINTYLRGVGGHPLKLKTCFVVQAESQGQKCAQAMDNDPNVKFVIEGVLPFGATGFHQTNKGKKPVMGFNPITTSSATAKNTYEVTAGLFGTDPGEVSYLVGIAAREDGRRCSIRRTIRPASRRRSCSKQIAGAAGLKVTAVGFSSTATDLLAPMTAANAQSTDASTVFFVNPSVCTAGCEGDGAASREARRRAGALSRPARPVCARRLPEVDVRQYRRKRQPAEGRPVRGRVARGGRADRQEEPGCLRAVPAACLGYGDDCSARRSTRSGLANCSPISVQDVDPQVPGPVDVRSPESEVGIGPGPACAGHHRGAAVHVSRKRQVEDATGGKWVGGR